MTSQKYLLGIDVSTTGAKALIIDQSGGVVSSATTPLTLFTPHPYGLNKIQENGGVGLSRASSKSW